MQLSHSSQSAQRFHLILFVIGCIVLVSTVVGCKQENPTSPINDSYNSLALTPNLPKFDEQVDIIGTPNDPLLIVGKTYSFVAHIGVTGPWRYRWRIISIDGAEIDQTGDTLQFTVLPSRQFSISVSISDPSRGRVLGTAASSRRVALPGQDVMALIQGMTKMEVVLTGTGEINYQNRISSGHEMSFGTEGAVIAFWRFDRMNNQHSSHTSGTAISGRGEFPWNQDETEYGSYTFANFGLALLNANYHRFHTFRGDEGGSYVDNWSNECTGTNLILVRVSKDTMVYQGWQIKSTKNGTALTGAYASEHGSFHSFFEHRTLQIDPVKPAILEVRFYR
ncbi:MAG: hypothetical protein ABI444_01630 [Candidatus Kapaibacterium sp.]|jgi:hypothetical protein